MPFLSDIFNDNTGFTKRGLASGGISPALFDYGIFHLWILNSSSLKTRRQSGIWVDDETWKDSSVWWD
jgi:hypothetical protein